MNEGKASLPFRLWYYMRTGFSFYLSFALSVFNTIILLQAFVLSRDTPIPAFFKQFYVLVVTGFLLIIPYAILMGWAHLKRMPAYKAEVDLMVESNPYFYKYAPGWQRQVVLPWMKFLANFYLRLQEKKDLLSEEDKKTLKELIGNLEILEKGGTVG